MHGDSKSSNVGESMSIGIAFLVVLVIVGAVVYILMKTPADVGTVSDTIKTAEDAPSTDSAKVQDKKVTSINNSDNKTKSMDTNKRLLENFTPVSQVTTLEKKDLVVGAGPEVASGATVSVHYTGAVAATGEVFQSSKDFGTDPITFPLSGVIKGWTDGIPGMKVGGTRRLVIPADQAYGANPPPRSGIPANAALVFDVELVAIK
jgi:FKBP-type peptidyl-prolyl cis-trans isomerase